MLCVLTNGVAPLTAYHSSPLAHSPTQRNVCRGTTTFIFLKTTFSLFTVSLSVPLSKGALSVLFCFLLAFFYSTDVPKNFTVKWATKTTVLLAWKFYESRAPYKCTVSDDRGHIELDGH